MGGYLLRNFHEFGHHFGVDFIYLKRDLLEAVKNELDDTVAVCLELVRMAARPWHYCAKLKMFGQGVSDHQSLDCIGSWIFEIFGGSVRFGF